MRPGASGLGFSVLLKNVQGIIHRMIQYSALKRSPGYYTESGSGFSVLLKMSMVLFSIWFRIQRIMKNVPGIIQSLVNDSAYY